MKPKFSPGYYQILKDPEIIVTNDMIPETITPARDKWGRSILTYLCNQSPYKGLDLSHVAQIAGAKWKVREIIFKLSGEGHIEMKGPRITLSDKFKVLSNLFIERYCGTEEELHTYMNGKSLPQMDSTETINKEGAP